MILEAVGSCGRVHSGFGWETSVSPVSLAAVCTVGEVVPLEGVEVVGKGGGVSSAGGLAKYLTGGCRRVRGGGP